MTAYDTIIIGAGMSGLAAGIRLAYYDQRVGILDKHDRNVRVTYPSALALASQVVVYQSQADQTPSSVLRYF